MEEENKIVENTVVNEVPKLKKSYLLSLAIILVLNF